MKTPFALILLIFFLFLGGVVLVKSNTFGRLDKAQSAASAQPTIKSSPSTVPEIGLSPDQTLFQGQRFTYPNEVYSGYTFIYPKSCSLESSQLHCKLAHGTATITINAGGHGGGVEKVRVIQNSITKIIPAGSGKISMIEILAEETVFGTYWINKTVKLEQEPIFGFEFWNIPTQDLKEFNKFFDQILQSFKFEEK